MKLFELLTEKQLPSEAAAKQVERQKLATKIELDPKTFQDMLLHCGVATESNIKQKFNEFVSMFPKECTLLNAKRESGIGPGEILLSFIFDNITLGGKNSPIDVFMDGKPFAEAKGGSPIKSENAISNFKITKDSSKAVTQVLSDLKKFNEMYKDKTGEDLPDWKGEIACTPESLKKWRSINLSELEVDEDRVKHKPINLQLYRDGKLFKKGEDEALANIETGKKSINSILKDLINQDVTVEIDEDINTLDKIEQRWVDKAMEEYVEGKTFILFSTGKNDESKPPKIVHVGDIHRDAIGLYCTTRNQPYAKIFLGKL